MALFAKNMISNTLVLTIFIFIFPFLTTQLANALSTTTPPTYVYHFCLNQTVTDFFTGGQSATRSLLSDLALHSSTYTFYNSSAGSGRNTSYGLFYCTGNVNAQDCNTCVQSAVSTAQSYCLFDKAAFVFYKECTLRYANWTVYATPDESSMAWYFTTGSVSYNKFNETLESSLDTVITEAGSKGFATGEASLVGTRQRLYALAQCTPDILGSDCQHCLQLARLNMTGCCNNDSFVGPLRTFILTFLPSCQLRYEVMYPSDYGSPPSDNGWKSLNGSSSSYPGKNVWYMMLALVVAAFGLQ